MNEEEIIDIKLILLGESGVGKTSIIKRYINDEFDPTITTSLTTSYVGKIIEKGKKKIKLNIWDTVGQEKFRSISKLFLKNTKIVIIVYSIVSQESFDNLDYWLNLYKTQLEDGTILGVAANKCDLFLEQVVSDEIGKQYAQKNNAIFGLISAKQNKNSIDNFIGKLIDAYLEKGNIIIKKRNMKLTYKNNENNNKSKGGCCSKSNDNTRLQRFDSIVKNFDGCINAVFLGDKRVGKTSIIKRIDKKNFDKNEKHTDEINNLTIEYNNLNMEMKVIIYDVDIDQIKSRSFINILKKSKIFFLVYDIKNGRSLDNLNFWIQAILRCKEEENDMKYLLYIIGNKDDNDNEFLENKEEKQNNKNISKIKNQKYINEGKKFSEDKNALFKVVSALENKGIENIIGEGVENYLCLK